MSISSRPGRLCSVPSRLRPQLNAAASRGISPDSAAALLPFLESTSVRGGGNQSGCQGGITFPCLQASFFPSSSPFFSPSELKQRLCSPHEDTRREVMGMLLHRSPCELHFFSHLQRRSAGAQERRSATAGSGRIRGRQKNFKHLYWRRVPFSFSFEVLTKEGDGAHSSRLSPGNPAALCGMERMGK